MSEALPASDPELLRAARGGDREALHALVVRYLPWLRDRRDWIRLALARMDPTDREVLELRIWQDWRAPSQR